MEKAIFAAGCFWGVEDRFMKLDGVLSTKVGYTGGTYVPPNYEKVCGGGTGHAEAIEIEFDPSKISYEELTKFFWKAHDPTTVNRQGPDVGDQYRSAIFYLTEEQKEVAERVKLELTNDSSFHGPIVTEITEAGTFFDAEEYHQKYFQKQGGGGVCGA